MTSTPRSPVPTSVFEAAVEVAGKAFYWKNTLIQLLSNAGVGRSLLESHRDNSKFTMVRQIWAHMDTHGPGGKAVQRRIVAELTSLEKPHRDAPDQSGAKAAIQELKRLALEHRVLVSPEEQARKGRREQHRAAQEQLHVKDQQRKALLSQF